MFVMMTSMVFAVNPIHDLQCEGIEPGEKFIGECPPDFRMPGHWFKQVVYTDDYGLNWCDAVGKLHTNCSYIIVNWVHPNVTGCPQGHCGGDGLPPDLPPATGVPEFGVYTLGLAIVGTIVGLAVLRKPKE